MKCKSGFSLIEMLITVTIMAVMVGTGSMYYSDVMQQTNKDKALSDLKQICKVMADFENSLPQGMLTSYSQISRDPELRDLEKLIESRNMASIPDDPWGNYYRIDIPAGIVYSQGQDFGDSFDHYRYTQGLGVEASISRAKDDVVVRFRPAFKPVKANLVNTVRSGKEVGIINIMFTRPVANNDLTTDTSFIISEVGGTAPPNITTSIVDVMRRHCVNLILDDVLITSLPWTLAVSNNGTIKSFDTTELENNYDITIVPSATY